MELWLKSFIKTTKTYKLDASAYGISFRLSRREETDHVTQMNKLDIFFEKMSAKLPPCTFWGKIQLPIPVIDEANELKALVKDPDGKDALMNFFK